MKVKPNLTGRAGQWSAEHPWRAIGLWLAFIVAAVLAGGAVGTAKLGPADASVGQSARADHAINAAFDLHAAERVMVRQARPIAADTVTRNVVSQLVSNIRATGAVVNLHSPLDPARSNQISADGRAMLVTFDVSGPVDKAATRVEPVLAVVTAAAQAHPQLTIVEAGTASFAKGVADTVSKDFKRAEELSVPLALLVLLITFGALVAALLPLGLALTAIAGGTGLLAFTSHLSGVDSSASSVMLLLGLAVGVDYCLFYVKREREERAKGLSPHDALAVAAATSGRSVLISGVTVLVALSGMFFTGAKDFIGLTEGALLVVAAAVVGALTVLPALLSLLGDKVSRGRLPFVTRLRPARKQPQMWEAVVTRVMARPARSLTLGVLVLVVLAIPAVKLHTAQPGTTDLPRNVPVVQDNNRVQASFPGTGTPAIVVVSAHDVTAPAVTAGIDQLTKRAIDAGAANEPVSVQISPDHTLATVTMAIAGDGENGTSTHALATLRDRVIPTTIGAVPGVSADVTGRTATNADINAQMKARAPIVFAFVLVLAFVLLLLAFRSIVVAAKAIVLNLLSVVASYGVLVAVFQWGWGERLLGFHHTGAIVSGLPLFLFVVLFSLSMDYHVFILSRVREAIGRGESTDDAVVHGVRSTASVVTAAAVVMVMTFGVFATLSTVSSKEFGIGLAAAVLLDATIVRGVLLPAAMKLLGERNWYLPRWLQWLPDMNHDVITLPDVAGRRQPATAPVLAAAAQHS